ncbi:MAG: YkgJ family cysteine cluster protein [Sulfurospirillum sp.]|nr:MAG: YkgJ family cysteine cluster protein [Sulfurospirillum sp.]
MQDIITKEGFDYGFDPSKCAECGGKCCTGESGYIWVTPAEIAKIAGFLGIAPDIFTTEYLEKVRYRYTLKERRTDEGFACIFFDTEVKNCSIYPVRPRQCITFPFWDYFKEHKNEVVEECPGIILS